MLQPLVYNKSFKLFKKKRIKVTELPLIRIDENHGHHCQIKEIKSDFFSVYIFCSNPTFFHYWTWDAKYSLTFHGVYLTRNLQCLVPKFVWYQLYRFKKNERLVEFYSGPEVNPRLAVQQCDFWNYPIFWHLLKDCTLYTWIKFWL